MQNTNVAAIVYGFGGAALFGAIYFCYTYLKGKIIKVEDTTNIDIYQ